MYLKAMGFSLDDVQLVSRLHDEATFQPHSNNLSSIQRIVTMMVIITGLSQILFAVVDRLLSTESNPRKVEIKKVWKVSYQAVNCLINLLLGIYGTYT